ncbi:MULTISPECIES: right-handed parallel beta-helix repeat-containing protein [Rhodopirellula]|uniref:right-handed parallel beta-helix repeat-containing protein n=1 Tax=Rhodopirellula TaxID=265488 RepID=UPI00257D90D6|nr:right-handed parallel beta-helix repeat-containing protein [Rhodopirellula sp. UBA1907]
MRSLTMTIGKKVFSVLAVLLLASWTLTPVSAEQFRIGPEQNWFEFLSGDSLRPADVVILSDGIYTDPRRLVMSHRGTAEQPIVIRADDGAKVIFRRPDAKQNTFNLEGTQHLTLEGFEITGGAAAIRIQSSDSHRAESITLEGLHIHHIGGVAVTCNHPGDDYRGMTFRRNHVHHTSGHGEAFYLGANNGEAVFHDSEVTDNYIHHLNGPNISQGDGIEVKQGSYANLVARNVIHNTNYPAITIYGTAGQPVNRVDSNVIWESNDSAMQVAADCIVRNNWVACRGHCLYSRNHQEAVVGNLEINGNVLLALGKAAPIRIIHPRDSSGANQLSGLIQIQHNVMVSDDGALAARIQNDALVRFNANRGNGKVDGSQQTLKDTINLSELRKRFPNLDQQHPAWKHLNRDQLLARFNGIAD